MGFFCEKELWDKNRFVCVCERLSPITVFNNSRMENESKKNWKYFRRLSDPIITSVLLCQCNYVTFLRWFFFTVKRSTIELDTKKETPSGHIHQINISKCFFFISLFALNSFHWYLLQISHFLDTFVDSTLFFFVFAFHFRHFN